MQELKKPETAKDFYKRGVEWVKKGVFDKAIKDFDEAIQLNPKLADAFYSRGAVLAQRVSATRQSNLDEAIRLNPKDAAAFYNRGVTWVKKDELEKAIKDYDEAIRLNPKYSEAFFNRGGDLGQEG